MSDTTTKSFIGKILFVLGIIVILIILASLIIRFVPKIFGGLANIGSSIGSILSKEEINVTSSDISLTNGERFVVSWSSNIKKTGLYNISHTCVDGVTIDIETLNGTRRLICGDYFTLGQSEGSVTLIASLKKENAFQDIPVSISFIQGEKVLASNNVVVTIQNGDPNSGTGISASPVEQIENTPATTPAVKPTTQTTKTYQTTTYKPKTVVYTQTATGPADLTVSNMALIGNNKVVFSVSNKGGRTTGNWTFNYNTPTDPKQTLASPLQPSIAPGQTILYTLTFNAKSAGKQTVVVQLDPNNQVSESSETNNVSSISLTGSAFGEGSNTGTDTSHNSEDDADFKISNLEVGRISGNKFVEDDSAEEGDDVAVRFIVKNIGGENTDDWKFEIKNLPYNNEGSYKSKEYNKLRPGESIEVIVRLDNVDEGDYEIEVLVDSEDDTDEESESNNDDSVDLEVRN